MKFLPLCILVLLAGCQTPTPPPTIEPQHPPKPVATPDPETALELRRQRQLVEALMSQNEALQAQLSLAGESPPAVVETPAVVAEPPPPAPSPAPEPDAADITLLMPNEDGVIDLGAAAALAAGEPVNPFVLRQPPAPGQETMITVQGIVRGQNPCALVNDRVLAVGDHLDALRLTRIEPEALFFEINDFTLRIPLQGGPVRVRNG